MQRQLQLEATASSNNDTERFTDLFLVPISMVSAILTAIAMLSERIFQASRVTILEIFLSRKERALEKIDPMSVLAIYRNLQIGNF